MSNSPLEDQVIELARLCRWKVAHFRFAQTVKGWRTPVAADGAGFPDLVMTRGRRLIFAEIKGKSGNPKPAQRGWLEALRETGNEVYVWRPRDLDAIKGVLR